MKNPRVAMTVAVLLGSVALLFIPTVRARQNNPNTDAVVPDSLPGYVIVELQALPLAAYDGRETGYPATRPQPGSRIDLRSPAAQAYAAYLTSKRQIFKNWLRANVPGAEVVQEFAVVLNGLAVKLNGHQAEELARGPNVARVTPSQVYHPTLNRSTTLINAPALWTAVGGQSNAGSGIKIGIIDSGIDQTHPFLTDQTLTVPPGFPKCDPQDSATGVADTNCLFTSNKVIVAKVFQLNTTFDAHAARDHGTHVSGIAAGVANTTAPFVGATLSGVAPKAFLGNYNVFPGNTVNAPDSTIINAVDTAVSDGMDVLNLSLGGTAVRANDPLENAVNHAVDAGLVVAIAAGNSGPGEGTIESPGNAAEVITAGASTNPHFLGIPVTVGKTTFGGALGQFANFVPAVTKQPYTTIPSPNAKGCTAISQSLKGEIALIRRGTCSFSTKIRNAQNAGAVGAIISNNTFGDPTAMAQDGTPNQPTIPAVMVSNINGEAMGSSGKVTVDGTNPQEFFTDGSSADIVASFSSVGPTPFTFQIKPDAMAPGVNVYSSVPSFDCSSPPCFAFFNGTSMATPHIAGSAALLRQLHPTWSPEQIKSALVNTAHRPVRDFRTGSAQNDPVDRGAGRIDLAAATDTVLTIDPVSVSFGVIMTAGVVNTAQALAVENVSGGSQSCSVSVTGPSIVTASTAGLSFGSGGSTTFTLILSVASSTANGEYFGDAVVNCGGGTPVLNVPWWVLVSR